MNGKEFKQARNRMALRSTEIAHLLGIRSETIWRWESGRVPVPESAVMEIERLQNDPAKVNEIKLNRNLLRQHNKENRRRDAVRQAELEAPVDRLVAAVCEANGIVYSGEDSIFSPEKQTEGPGDEAPDGLDKDPMTLPVTQVRDGVVTVIGHMVPADPEVEAPDDVDNGLDSEELI